MSIQILPSHPVSAIVFAGYASQRERVDEYKLLPRTAQVSASALSRYEADPIVYGKVKTATVRREAPHDASFEEKLFDAGGKLKVLVSQYAMHLSTEQRQQILNQIDDVINAEDWHVEDVFPKARAFQELLKWSIYSGNYRWRSLGVSDAGEVLVAWMSNTVLLTASFSGEGNIRWTARIRSETGLEHVSGISSLQYFARQADFYLQQ